MPVIQHPRTRRFGRRRGDPPGWSAPRSRRDHGFDDEFSEDKLRELYGTPEKDRDAFSEGVRRLVDERWIDTADGDSMIESAGAVHF